MLFVGLPIFYLLICAAVYLLQERLLYYPSRLHPAEARQLAASHDLKIWQRSDGEIHGYVANDNPGVSGTILVFHGNAGFALDRVYYIGALKDFGYRIILVEYPGYGPRKGEMNEESLVADGLATATEVIRRYPGRLIVWGESLGCGIASAIIRELPEDVSGAVLLTPWNNLPALAQISFWFLPARWLCRDSYDNVANLADFRGPTVFVVAGQDRVIPNRLSGKLYHSYQGPKHLIEFEGAGHNSWPAFPGLEWWAEAIGFLERNAS